MIKDYNILSARKNSMTKLCRALFKYENKIKNWLRKLMYNFVVHSNDIPCRIKWHLGLDPVITTKSKGTPIIRKNSIPRRDGSQIILAYNWSFPIVDSSRNI